MIMITSLDKYTSKWILIFFILLAVKIYISVLSTFDHPNQVKSNKINGERAFDHDLA